MVATDGHRLAMDTEDMNTAADKTIRKVIVPRKGILEFARLLGEGEDNVDVVIGSNHIRAKTANFTFTSKLVDGKFPDYDRVLPKGGDKKIIADRNELRQSLSRTAISLQRKVSGNPPDLAG